MRKNIHKIFVVIMLVFGLGLFSNAISSAARPDPCTTGGGDTTTQLRCGVTGSGGTGAKNQGNQVTVVIRVVVNILLFLIGAFAVIMIVIAGFRYVASNGDANTVSSAKNTIIYALVGLAVAFLAYALVNFVIDQLIQGSKP